jgi:hypothetical protein
MQQREALRHVERGHSALTPQGAARVAAEMLGRPVAEHELATLNPRDLLDLAHPSLLDPSIGSDAVAPAPSEREMRDWRSDHLADPGTSAKDRRSGSRAD